CRRPTSQRACHRATDRGRATRRRTPPVPRPRRARGPGSGRARRRTRAADDARPARRTRLRRGAGCAPPALHPRSSRDCGRRPPKGDTKSAYDGAMRAFAMILTLTLLARPAAAFDTWWHAEATRKACEATGFSADARLTMQVENYLTDVLAALDVVDDDVK